jgi:hypothetical protein
VIESSFGQSGKVRVYFAGGLPADLLASRTPTDTSPAADGGEGTGPGRRTLRLTFKRYVFDRDKRMHAP